MKRVFNIASAYPIADIQGNQVLANNGNIVLGFRVELPEIYSQSEKDFEELHSQWFQGLKSLPIGTVIHKQDIYLKKGYDASVLPSNTFLSRATADYFNKREYLEHSSYVFFIWPKNKAFNKARLINPFIKIPAKLPELMDTSVQEFSAAVQDSVSFINNGNKLLLTPLSDAEILSHTDSYFNGFNTGVDTDISFDKNGLQIGEHHFQVLSINSERCFGESVASSRINPRFTSDDFSFHQGFIDGLGLSLNENHIVNQILFLDDKHHWRKLLDKRVEELKKSSNFGSQNKVVLQKIEAIRETINTDDNSRIIRGHLNVIYWDSDPNRLSAIAAKIKTEFKEIDMVPYYPLGASRVHAYLNSYPLFSSNFSNQDLYVTDLKHGLCLLINNSNYRSDSQGVVFNDRQFNIPVVKDVWDRDKKRIKARNFAIFAPTGEGKSFLANNILRQYFEQGVRLVIIDLGGSYTKFASLYPDQFTVLRYQGGKSLGINPFYLATRTSMEADRLEDLALFVFELLSPGKKVSQEESVALKKVLWAYYQKSSGLHSLQGFYGFVKGHGIPLLKELGIERDYFNISRFLHVLSEYVQGGLYSFLFETGKDQSYRLEEKKLIVFELDEVRDNQMLLSVMLKLIKTAIQRTIWSDKSHRGIILFDEFAKQLKFPNVLKSVEFYYQAIRKQEGAIGIILQSINQLPENAASASILENTQVIYSLRNEKGYDELIRRLKLSSHDLNQLRSLRNNLSGDHKYTEIFLKIGKESNVFRLEVPQEVYAAYLTDGPDHQAIMALYKKEGDMVKAIKTFLKSFNNQKTNRYEKF